MLGAGYYPAARVQYRELRQKAKLELELRGLQTRNAKLRDQVARLKTPEGLEDLARTQLGLVKKGEHVAVIVDEDADNERDEATSPSPKLDHAVPTAAQTKDTGWTAFLDAFFGVEQ